jgi:hypothetical protein
MSYPNCNLVLNCPGSPRCFSNQELQDGKCPFHWNWLKNLIMTLISIDGVLLEVHNRMERCRAWSLVAMTSHVWTFSILFSKTWRAWALPYLSQVPAIWLGFACVCPTSVGYTPCFLLSSSYTPQSSLCTDYSSVSSSQFNGIIHHFLNSPSCRNLRSRFLLRGKGCNTPCYVIPCFS